MDWSDLNCCRLFFNKFGFEMIRKALLFLILLMMTLGVSAQTEDVIETLTSTAAAMKSMQCRFEQEKNMEMLEQPTYSEGRMCYIAPDKMRWEYTKPLEFALVVEDDKITKITDGKEEVVDSKSSRMYQGIVSIIMSSATGKNLFDKSTFDVTISDAGDYWKAEMKPKKRDMKRMLSMLTFYFEKERNIINKVEYTEAAGDVTTIQFLDIIINENIELCD